MVRVLLESPYAGKTEKETEKNVRYARACAHDCFLRGEAPFPSHLLYTQEGILDDKISEERAFGIEAGLEWGKCAKKSVVYIDLGVSRGMKLGIINAMDAKRPIEFRNLPPRILAEVLACS